MMFPSADSQSVNSKSSHAVSSGKFSFRKEAPCSKEGTARMREYKPLIGMLLGALLSFKFIQLQLAHEYLHATALISASSPLVLVTIDSGSLDRTTAFHVEDNLTVVKPPPKISDRSHRRPESLCYTSQCPLGRINKILFKPVKPAGLQDRWFLLEAFGNIAGYLCATLYVAPPNVLLRPNHNVGFPPLDPGLSWDDFAEFLFLEDDRPVIKTIDDASLYALEANATKDAAFYLKSLGGRKAVADFMEVEKFFLEQHEALQVGNNPSKGFLWVIDCPLGIFPWLRRMQSFMDERKIKSLKQHDENAAKYPLSSCNYIHRGPSTTMHDIAGKVWQKLKETRNIDTMFVSLHVRRTDVVTACNTSIDALTKYLDCSLNGTSALTGRMVILFSSDEKNVGYRMYVTEIPQQKGSSITHAEIIDLDHLVLETMHELVDEGKQNKRILNNYFLFAVIQAIQEQTIFKLARRREDICNDCDSIAEQIAAYVHQASYWKHQCFPKMYCGLAAHNWRNQTLA